MSTNAASEDAPWTHKLAKGAVEQLGGPVQSFEPVNQICQVRSPRRSLPIILYAYIAEAVHGL